VGLIDADFDNSNFAQFTNEKGEIGSDPVKGFEPFNWNGIQVFSMSLIAGRSKSVSFTGDRYWQFMHDIATRSSWDCEYFIVDLPSGSGDVFKASIHVFAENLVGDIIVTQPSMIDASRRVLNLHKYFEIPVLGLIENMSYFECWRHKTPAIYHPFGESVVEMLAEEYKVEVLGKIPLIADMPERLAAGSPWIDNVLGEPIQVACEKIVEAEVQKPGFFEKLKEKLMSGIKTQFQKILAHLIIAMNKEIPIEETKKKTGFVEERPFLLRIVDESRTREITSIGLQVKGNKVAVLKPPYKKIDYEIIGSFRTFARAIMGKMKTNGEFRKVDPLDLWLNGDLVTAGMGYAPKAVHAFRSIFGNEEFMKPLREKYGSVLEKWI